MKKFLETFAPDVSLWNLTKVFPEYAKLFDKIEDLDEKVKRGVSKQVEIEYYDLMDSLDGFLLQPENIDKYNQAWPQAPLDKDLLEIDDTFDEEEAKLILESEISDLMKDVDDKIISAQIQSDQAKVKKKKQETERERITKDMIGEADRYVGISFNQDKVRQGDFEKAFTIYKVGCKFKNVSYSNKNFVMFDFGGKKRIIIETPELVDSFDDIFLSRTDLQLTYLLAENRTELNELWNIMQHAFDFEDDSVSNIDDDFLYNNPVIYGSYQDFLYQNVSLYKQDKGLIERGNYIKDYFNLYLPIEQICVLTLCKQMHSTMSKQVKEEMFSVNEKDGNKENIEKIVRDYRFNIEGLGKFSPRIDTLSILQQKNLIDNRYEPTPYAAAIFSYNFLNGPTLQPDFRALMYYSVNLSDTILESPVVSTYDGVSLYTKSKTLESVDYALSLTPQQVAGSKKAEEAGVFPQSWQDNQPEFDEYLPFAADGSLEFKIRDTKGDKLINFQDYKKFYLYVASTYNPYMIWGLNSTHYNYVKYLYGDRKTKLLGPREMTGTDRTNLFFRLVDENNKVLALLRPLGVKSKTEIVDVDQSGNRIEKKAGEQVEFKFSSSWVDLRSEDFPRPVWDYEAILDALKERNGDFMIKVNFIDEFARAGEYKDLDDLEPSVEERERIDSGDVKEDMDILDDAVEEQSDDEKMAEKKIELTALQELLVELGGDDEDVKKEIEEKEKEIGSLMRKSEYVEEEIEEEEEKEVEEKVDDFDKEKILDEINDDFRYSFPSSLKAEQVSVEREGDEVRLDTRYLGDWFVPDDAEDEEDYDYEELDRDDYKRFRDKFNEWVSSKDWGKYVETFVQPQEKNWIDFSVRLKK